MNNTIDRKQQILKSAIDLFSRTHDVKRVSLETIAREAHVSPTTIYNYFGTREKLVYEVIKTLLTENLERNRQIVRSNIPFPEKLIGIISGKLDMVSKVNGEILNKLITQDKTIAPFMDEIYENEIKPLLREIISDGKKQGFVDASLDDEVLLVYFNLLRAGYNVKKDALQKFVNNLPLLQQFSHIIYYGFLKKDIDFFRKEDKQ